MHCLAAGLFGIAKEHQRAARCMVCLFCKLTLGRLE